MTTRLLDCHNHLQDGRLGSAREGILVETRKLGVDRMVVNGTREADWAAVAELARRDERILPSFGLHPWYVPEATPDWPANWLRYLTAVPSAVGEIGLDRWISGYDSASQEAAFLTQWRVAAERNLPVTVHCLRAWGRLLELVTAEARPECGFLLHSYGGPPEMIPAFTKLGAYFSISGYFAQPRKAKQAQAFRAVPMERLLIETDAPDMLPPASLIRLPLSDPATGTLINHPGNLGAIYEFAAELRGMTVAELASQVEGNFGRLFGGIGRR